MIIIDGSDSNLRIENFANLEEILIRASVDSRLENRIVTDVLLNEQNFSEIYPHQAEDITAREIKSVEIISMPCGEMALNIARELFKVAQVMAEGSQKIAGLLRENNKEEAIELLLDLLDVTRDFMSMVGVLRTEFVLTDDTKFSTKVEEISMLLGEMSEVLETEDWILLSDLLEFEFMPVCESWKHTIQELREDIRVAIVE